MIAIYSNEPVFEGLYSPFLQSNGNKIRLVNINRNNSHNVIYLNMGLLGKVYVDIYRGYLDSDGKLQYELSNHQLIDSPVVTLEQYHFQDFTANDYDYINYYIEIESIGNSYIYPTSTGLYFDGIDTMQGLSNQVSTNISNDVNSNPLQQQLYTKLTNFRFTTLNAYKEQIIHVLEKPFYVINNQDCIDYESKRLANRNIGIKYITSHSKYIEVTLTNIEAI